MRKVKTEYVGVRVTLEDKEKLRKKCLELGYPSISECLRRLLARL